MEDLHWKSGISKVEQNKILLRGRRIEELIGHISYGEAVYLTLKGDLPQGHEGKIIEAILVSVIDHGPTPPSSLTARTIASTGAELNAAVAGGILAISHFHGGAIEECLRVLQEAINFHRENNTSVEEAAARIVQSYRNDRRRIHGFGHRLHTRDPRSTRLFELARHWNVAGEFICMVHAVEKELGETLGKELPINADGAIAALLGDIGFEPALADAFFMMARVPGLVAHIYEEKTRYKPMRRIHPTDVEYDGPEERSHANERES